MIWYSRKHLWMQMTYIQYRQKYGISGKHNRNSCIFRFVLVEMAWHQPQIMDVMDEKCNLQCPKLKIHIHDDVIKWKLFPRYWPFVRGIHRSPVNSPHKGQWRGALMFSLIYAWINDWVNNGEAGDLRETLSGPLWRHCNVESTGMYHFSNKNVCFQ